MASQSNYCNRSRTYKIIHRRAYVGARKEGRGALWGRQGKLPGEGASWAESGSETRSRSW